MPAVLPQLRVITPSREVTKIDAVDAPDAGRAAALRDPPNNDRA